MGKMTDVKMVDAMALAAAKGWKPGDWLMHAAWRRPRRVVSVDGDCVRLSLYAVGSGSLAPFVPDGTYVQPVLPGVE